MQKHYRIKGKFPVYFRKVSLFLFLFSCLILLFNFHKKKNFYLINFDFLWKIKKTELYSCMMHSGYLMNLTHLVPCGLFYLINFLLAMGPVKSNLYSMNGYTTTMVFQYNHLIELSYHMISCYTNVMLSWRWTRSI